MDLPGLPRRAVLRPDLHVVRRGEGELQVGIDPPQRLIVTDDPTVRGLLTDLGAPTDLSTVNDSEPAARLLRALASTGMLVDADDLAAHRLGAVAREGAAAAHAQHGPAAGPRLQARAAATVALTSTDDLDLTLAIGLLERSGLPVVPPDAGADVHLVAAAGELPRAALDHLVREGQPHLVVSGRAGRPRVGPFVDPGRTACLRCVDAHEAIDDLRRSLIVEHCVLAARGRGPVVDPVLSTLALAWAVRDLLRFVEGDQPSTWSATVVVGELDAPVVRPWARHPDCGCAWDQLTA